MHKMCRYTLYAETTLRSNDHHLYLNSADRKDRDTGNNKMEQRSQELDWDMHMLYFHSLSSSRVISVEPVFDPQNQVGVIVLTGMIWKGKARCVDSADTVCVQEYHVHLNVDDLWFLPADFLPPRLHHFKHPWSLRWWPIRFERMDTMLITDCMHTPGHCTRASSRWCSSNHQRVALTANTPSHLLRTRRWRHDDHWSKRRIKSLEEATFSEQCAKKSVWDDYVRPFSQLVVRKCLSFVFLHSHQNGLF